MTRPLASLEHFFERIFERPAARLFQTSLEPVQVQRRLERAMDAGRESRSGYVPDRFQVFVHPAELESIGDLQVTLEGEFAEGLLVRSHQRGYRLAQRPVVSFVADPTVGRGEVAIEAGYGPALHAGEARSAPPTAAPVAEPGAVIEPEIEPEIEPDEVSIEPDADVAPGMAPGRSAEPAIEPVPEPLPIAAPAPAPEPPALHAYLHIASPGKPLSRMPVGPAMIRIGRGPDNDLVVPDVRVSRQQGTIAVRHGLLVYTDLDSTNGSFVNGTRVAQIALGPGDVLRVGDTTITIVPAT